MRDFALPKNPFLALLVAPLLGGLFVMFLPLLGFWLLAKAAICGIAARMEKNELL